MRSYHHVHLSFILIVGLLAACGGSGDASSDEASTMAVASDEADSEDPAPAVSGQECPLSESPSVTYDAGELPLRITFKYPSGWNILDESDMGDGMVKVSIQKPFEVDGSSSRLALELIQTGRTLPKESIERMTTPRSVNGLSANQDQEEIQLGGETITVGRTIASHVVYKMGLPGEDGYHLTTLHMWWDGKDRCKDEVLELGSAILQTFALR